MVIKEGYEKSVLAEASYADFRSAQQSDGSYDSGDVEIALIAAGFSGALASNLVRHWTVVNHKPDTATGFSATVFESLDSPGSYTLAIRGTDPAFIFSGANDWLTNLGDIAGDGIAIRQAIALFNYFQELTAVAGRAIIHYGYVEESVDLFGNVTPAHMLSINTGVAATDGDLAGRTFSVAGHSLGGHLAMIMSRLAPAAVEQVYSFNGPGFDTPIGRKATALGSEGFFDMLRDASAAPIAAGWDSAGIDRLNVAGDVIGDIGKTIPGAKQVVFTETTNQGAFESHGIAALTDALAVHDLLANLDTGLTLAQVTPFLALGSNQNRDSLESVVNAVGDLFKAGSELAPDDRNALYTRIQLIESTALYRQSAGFVSLVPIAMLVGAAAEDTPEGLAYRYALDRLNPFAIVGDPGMYVQHNANGELAAGRYTEPYLADRASLLDLKNRVFGADLGTGSVTAFDRIEYSERTSGLLLNTTVIGPDPSRRIVFDGDTDAPLVGGPRDDSLYGGVGDDALEGNGGDDYLEGGAGNDTYIFKTGDGIDTLFDSDGLGRIVLRTGAGDATLGGSVDSVPGQENLYRDSEGNRYAVTDSDLLIELAVGGAIRVRNFVDGMLGISLRPVAAPAATPAPTGTPLFELGQPVETRYAVSPTVNGPVQHPVYGPGPWDPYLTETITAQGATGPALNATGNLIAGQVAGGLGDSYIEGDAGFNYLIDDLWYSVGSLSGTPVDWLSGDPVFGPLLQSGIFFSLGQAAGNDVLHGGGGNDWLMSHGGDDVLYGEDGDDLLLDNPGLDFGDNRWLALPGSSSDDRLFGGDGRDVLISLQGEDYLDGGEGRDVLLSGQGDDTLSGGAANDWLLADAALNRHGFVLQPDGSYTTLLSASEESVDFGRDFLFGDGGDDTLAGGGGDDWLLGGLDNDTLWGDGSSALDATGATRISVGDGAIAGHDTLFGEQGDDVLLGGGGDDYLDGGAGNDQLEGDHADLDPRYHGNDRLSGGDGDDVLVGNGGDDRLFGDPGSDRLWGDDGNDWLSGGEGKDTLHGGKGDDRIAGGAGDDILNGGEAGDRLFGDAGADLFDGGEGDDILAGGSGDDGLYGSAGNDRLDGGTGTDSLFGGAGDDVYVINPGNGQDVIVDTQGRNGVAFGAGVTADSLDLREIQANDGAYYLVVEYGAAGDRVLIRNGPLGAVVSFSFADGSVLSFADLMAQSGLHLTGNGGDGDDIIQGGNAADSLLGGAGSDQIHGGAGSDQLLGGPGNDLLHGDGGDDILSGGSGDDELRGGSGTDSYRMAWGMGRDTLVDEGTGTSVLSLDPGVRLSDLTMSRDGNDLVVQFKGVSDGVRIRDFALGDQAWELRSDAGTGTPIDDALINDAGISVPDSAVTAMQRYQSRIEGIYYATLATDSVRGSDGVFRNTTSRATSFGATTEFSSIAFARTVQTSDDATVARLSTPYVATRLLTGQETISSAVLNVGAGQTVLDTRGATFSPVGGSATSLPSGAILVNTFARPQDLDGDLSLDSGGHTRPIGYWTFPQGGASTQFTGLPFSDIPHYTYRNEALLTLEHITAGAANNAIETSMHASVVDAGGGDDVVSVRNGFEWDATYSSALRVVPYRYDAPFNPRDVGVFLYGNDGNDRLSGGAANDVLAGGAGDDYLDGGFGQDTYFVPYAEIGRDVIADSGALATHPETFSTRYRDWYYRSVGMHDWEQREQRGETLPVLPQVPINDFGSLEQLAADSVIQTDTVEFGVGIRPDDLTITWGEYLPHADPGAGSSLSAWMDAGSMHSTLDIGWTDGSGIRVLMPHTSPRDNGVDPQVLNFAPNLDLSRFDWFLGTGIEQFRFSDGSVRSMQEMLSAAPAPPTLDPHRLDNVLDGTDQADQLFGAQGDDVLRGGAGGDVYLFSAGDGVDRIEDSVDSGGANVIRFGQGIAPDDLKIVWTSEDLTIEVGSGGDAIVIANSDRAASDPTGVIATLVFESFDQDTGEVDMFGVPLADLLPPPPTDPAGEQLTGTAGNDTLFGTAGNDTIDGLAGNDRVFAGDGSDTIVGGSGRDTLYGEAGNDVFLIEGSDRSHDIFDGGEGQDSILGGAGDDAIRLRRFGVDNSVEMIDGGGGHNTIAGTGGRDRIDLAATAVSGIDFIDTGAGNDRVTGSNGSDVILGGPGRDVLNGGDGDDTFIVEGTDDAHDTFFGGRGADAVTGGAGDDTIRLRRFAANNSIEVIDGGAGRNVIAGTGGADRIDLSATTVSHIEQIDVGAGNDRVTGSEGDDVILGGPGRDVLNGGRGSDIYLFNRNDGRDRIVDTDASPNTDVIRLGVDIRHDQLWFSRVGDHLSVELIGTRDELLVENWYLGAARQIESLQSGDGLTLLNTRVDQLVQSMAAFSAPANGELDLSSGLHNQLEPVLAASWQSG